MFFSFASLGTIKMPIISLKEIYNIMIKFSIWLESRMFEIPEQAKNILPSLTERIKQLSQKNWDGAEQFAELDDTLTDGKIPIYLISSKKYYDMGLRGQGCVRNNDMPTIYYRIPMTDFDTIYHELTHAYDPQLRKNVSKPVWRNGFQKNTTPHERLAINSARMHEIKNASPQEKAELINWLRKEKTENDLEPERLPKLLRNMGVLYLYFKNKKYWRQFVSSLWHVLTGESSNQIKQEPEEPDLKPGLPG